MKNKYILFIIVLLSLCSCSGEKRLDKDNALKRANNYSLETLNNYESLVEITTKWELEAAGSFKEGGDLYSSLPVLNESIVEEDVKEYFYTKEKIEPLNLSTSTSNGIEKTIKIYSYLNKGLKIESIERIKAKSSGYSFAGNEINTTYILDDGRVEKIISKRDITTTGDNDDLKLKGSYRYTCIKSLKWVEII